MTEDEAQQQCQSTYLNNLIYFEKFKPEIFNMITLFETAIETNMYQARYDLEFKKNSFYIKVLEDNSLLYDKNLDSDATKRIQSITMDDKRSLKTFEPQAIPKQYTIDENIVETHLELLYPMIEYSQKYSSKTLKMNKLEKFIFFGAYLGRHIELFVKIHKPKVILITELDIEVFKLSLFVTDYSKIAEKTNIFFSITQDQNLFNKVFKEFLEDYELYNYILKFDIFNNNYFPFVDTVLNQLSTSRAVNWPFTAHLKILQREGRLINKKYNFIDFSKIYDIFDTNTPIILLAPGPSLITHIKWIKEHQDKFIIVSLGSATSTLYKHNIKPDIITSVDPQQIVMNQFKDIPKEFLKDIIFITSSNTVKDVVDLFTTSNTYIYQVVLDILGIGALGGQTVGDVTVMLLLRLGVQRLYLLGTDLCVDKTTGATHVKTHMSFSKTDQDEVKVHNLFDKTNISRENIVETKGNFQEKVFTTRHYYNILSIYERHITSIAKSNTKIFNLSDGAFIPLTIPTRTTNIQLDSFQNKHKILKNFTTKIIAPKLLIVSQKDDIELADKIIKLLYKYKNNDYNTYNDMMYDKLTINIDILTLVKNNKRMDIVNNINSSFNNNVEGYINTFFHNKKNKVNKKRFNKLFQLWLEPQITIYEVYKKILESIKQ